MNHKCLYCYKPLNHLEKDFHAACSKKIFGQAEPPILPYNENDGTQHTENDEGEKCATSYSAFQSKCCNFFYFVFVMRSKN